LFKRKLKNIGWNKRIIAFAISPRHIVFTYTGVYSHTIYVRFQSVGFFCREICTCPLTHSLRSVRDVFRYESYVERHNRVHLLYNMRYRAKFDENMLSTLTRAVFKKYLTDDITFTVCMLCLHIRIMRCDYALT